jgi:hypothetical protein
VQAKDIIAGTRFLAKGLQASPEIVNSLLRVHPHIILAGVSAAFVSLSAAVPIPEEDLKVMLWSNTFSTAFMITCMSPNCMEHIRRLPCTSDAELGSATNLLAACRWRFAHTLDCWGPTFAKLGRLLGSCRELDSQRSSSGGSLLDFPAFFAAGMFLTPLLAGLCQLLLGIGSIRKGV